MEEVEECLESESDVLVLLQSSSESRQSTELELSMSEGGEGGYFNKIGRVHNCRYIWFTRFFKADNDKQKENKATVSDCNIHDGIKMEAQ